MQQIIKRLELIKTAISIEDEEIIELQIAKLQTLNIDGEVENILNKIEQQDYEHIISLIDTYIARFNGMVVYEDKELQGLRLELKVLEQKLQGLSEEKNTISNIINDFNTQYNIRLGERISEILLLRKELLNHKRAQTEAEYKKIKKECIDLQEAMEEISNEKDKLAEQLKSANMEDYDNIFEEMKKLQEDYESLKEKLDEKKENFKELEDTKKEDEDEENQAKQEYEEFSSNYEEEIKDKPFELTDQEKVEIKKLYRKASMLCHPDIVAKQFKEQAEKLFIALNEAYMKKDLLKVKEILLSLEKGSGFEVSSNSIKSIELLRIKINELREKIIATSNELEAIKNEESYQTINEIADWDEYFNDLGIELENEIDRLKSQFSLVNTDKEDDYWTEKF